MVLLVSDQRIGFLRLDKQIRLLCSKALEICITIMALGITHEREKSRSGPESWRDFWHIYFIFLHLPVSGLNRMNVFLFLFLMVRQ